ncbi:hypothetical protein ATL17_1940 [Maritalea mobilis]|uniref:Uncharacterized protein n=1 Tax=Maritalea mobilis TaxID=483324 RepID=A0A4R6VUM5_9HYPH|nr:hypothetical protein ATL17_1940 [Maritalea mobilis]
MDYRVKPGNDGRMFGRNFSTAFGFGTTPTTPPHAVPDLIRGQAAPAQLELRKTPPASLQHLILQSNSRVDSLKRYIRALPSHYPPPSPSGLTRGSMQRKPRRTPFLNYLEDSPTWIPTYARMTLCLYEAPTKPPTSPRTRSGVQAAPEQFALIKTSPALLQDQPRGVSVNLSCKPFHLSTVRNGT